jgi:hypothetical protein
MVAQALTTGSRASMRVRQSRTTASAVNFFAAIPCAISVAESWLREVIRLSTPFCCHAREGGHPVTTAVSIEFGVANLRPSVSTGSSAFADDDSSM